MMISTRNLSLLPDIPTLRRLMQSIALLDAILMPEWEYRHFSFYAHPEDTENRMVGSMRDGSGDDYYCVFSPAGVILKGFAHESQMTPFRYDPPRMWTGVLDSFPSQFQQFLDEPAFNREETTFCIWRTIEDTSWQRGVIEFPPGKDPDGSEELLYWLDGNPATYREWAEDNYARPIEFSVVAHIYQHRPLENRMIAALNPKLSLKDLTADIAEIGYGQTSD